MSILDQLTIVETVINGQTFQKVRSELLAQEEEIAINYLSGAV